MAKAAKTGTFVDTLEDSVEDIARWATDYVETMVELLAPDGRAFGMEKLTEEEELKMYMNDLRGNEQAWAEWIRTRVEKVKEILARSGLDENQIMSAHPYDIVERSAILYSARMENLRNRIIEKEAMAEEDERRELNRTLPAEEESFDGGRG